MGVTAWACSDEAAELGEGPRWDAHAGHLLWVDILGETVRTATAAADGRLTTTAAFSIGRPVGAAAPYRDRADGWILAAGQGFARLAADGTVTVLAEPEATQGGRTRMNDAACDPRGRLWAGSLAFDASPGAGSVYVFDLDGSVRTALRGVTISNGIGWSPDEGTMYFVDSGPGTVDAFAFDAATGAISDRRTVIRIDPGDGVPDGLTVDDEGCLWIAIWGAGEVRRYAPDGCPLISVSVPASQPSSCCLGGSDGRTLFITTARTGLPPGWSGREPDAGRVHATRVDVAGPPLRPYRGTAGR